MKLSCDRSVLAITPESNFEQELIHSEYLKTKLSYRIIKDNPENFLDIKIEKRQSYINWEEKIVYINSMYSNFQMSYMLRIVSDAYSVMSNSLPLHAAMITTDTKHIYILGNSQAGKSTLASFLSNWHEKISVIGDDHVIVSDDFISGNTVLSRKNYRCKDKQNINNHDNSHIDSLGYILNKNSYLLIDVNLQSEIDSCHLIDKNGYIKGNLSHITKYLHDDFFTQVEKIQIEEFVGNEIINKYKMKLFDFIEGASMIICVSGKLDNVYGQLKEILLKEL